MEKVAHCRRAIWGKRDDKKTLSTLMAEALSKCPTVAATKYNYRSSISAQITERFDKPYVGVYFTLFYEGDPVATVENGGTAVKRRKAPKGEEFIRTGIHMIFDGDYIAYTADGQTNDGQITSLIHQLFEHCKFDKSHTIFQIFPKANSAALQAIIKDGVKSIDIGLSSFEVDADDVNSSAKVTKWDAARQALLKPLNEIFGKDRDQSEVEAASQIEVNLGLSFDGRSSTKLTSLILSEIAQDAIDNAGEFKIITTSGDVITHDKLSINNVMHVEGDRQGISPDSAYHGLCKSIDSWKSRKLL